MSFETLAPIILIFMRYAISGVGVFLASKGMAETDVNSLMDQLPTIATGFIVASAPAIWAAFKRPSVKAMEAAKQIDKQIPAGSDVHIPTPGAGPDIYIPATKKERQK